MKPLLKIFTCGIFLSFCNWVAADNTGMQHTGVENQDKIILVTGVTGRQGGAVARELVSRGYHIRGLTRNPESVHAREMAELGIDMVRGDYDDPTSLDLAMQGAYGVFSVQNFWEHGYEAEVRQGKNVADAARRTGIKHFIYTSVADADQKTGIPHFDSKYEIEQYIQLLRLPYTILRPVSFMENWEYARDEILSGKLSSPHSPDTIEKQISVRDIGKFAAEAFDHPDKWMGRALNIAGDQNSMREIVALFSRITGRPVQYIQMPWDRYAFEQGEEMTIMDKWIDSVGYSADIAAARLIIPDMLTLEQYLSATGWAHKTAAQSP